MSINRRRFLQGAGAAAAGALAAPALAQVAANRLLKFVPSTNLSILDPIWTTATVTRNHGYLIFDTLFSVDANFRPKPQMAEGFTLSDDRRVYRIRLREGLKFHDGEPVRAADCVASIARWSARDPLGQTIRSLTDEMPVIDDRTFEVRLKRPFPLFIDALAKPSTPVPFVMPKRMADTDPMQQISETVGSGPFRFVRGEFVAGSRVVYTRNPDYVPRQEAAEWATGGKVAHFDRVEWVVIPDPATAGSALQTGEVDWWETPLSDLLPVLNRNRNIAVEIIDPIGNMPVLRFNHLHPPFNNVALRRVVLGAVVQQDYLRAMMGANESLARECYSMYPCGTPLESTAGAEPLRAPRDLERSKAALRAAGYNGEKVVIITPSDQPTIHPQSLVTADLLQRLGMNVDLITTDWGTMLQRRASQEPVERGGWSIFHTTWVGGDIINPAVSAPLRGNGTAGWAGWATNAETERLREQWFDAPNETEQKRIAAEIQRLAFESVPFIPLGMIRNPTAYRRNLTGMLNGPAPLMWNLRKT